jgi:hypothetical protein
MKNVWILLLFLSSVALGQITADVARDSVQKYHIASYSYHEEFIGKKGYGAPLILTADGGAAVFGDGDEGTMLVKLDKAGKVTWKKTLAAKGEETESQSVAQDKLGNYFVFQLVYGTTDYRGGRERVVMFNKSGALLWDKYIGTGLQINNPIVSYIKALPDGRIYLRGHIVLKAPAEDKDPDTRYWEGWLNAAGLLTQKSGEIIDWKKPEWQSKFKPD